MRVVVYPVYGLCTVAMVARRIHFNFLAVKKIVAACRLKWKGHFEQNFLTTWLVLEIVYVTFEMSFPLTMYPKLIVNKNINVEKMEGQSASSIVYVQRKC